MEDKYYVRNPSRIYVSKYEGVRTTDIAQLYQWGQNRSNGKLDAEDTARRIVALLNMFDGMPTEEIEARLFTIKRHEHEAAG